MKVRLIKNRDIIGEAHRFNGGEVIAYFDGCIDSYYISDLDVFITTKNEWMTLIEAFKNNDIITDNYNTEFFEPQNEEERERGYRD